jgi:ABC-type multidrug transport system fused ATPase/permease subunit
LVTTVSYGILIVAVAVAVVAAVAGLVLAQRLIPLSLRKQSNTVTGTIYAALYMMFGVSLGFSLFLVWQQFNTARQTAENGATSLQQVYNLAVRFPNSEQDRGKELAVSYARVVVEEEWDSLEQGRPSGRAEALLDQLRQSVVVDLDPRSDAQDALYAASLQEVDDPRGEQGATPARRP